MSIEKLHQDTLRRQKEFPVCKDSIFLSHAGVSPLPACVQSAIDDYLKQATLKHQEDIVNTGFLTSIREGAARLLGCHKSEIALVGPTSVGLSLIANGLDWQSGDRVAFYKDDFPSNAFPWMAMAAKGVETDLIQPKQLGAITLDDVKKVISKKTRLVSVASAHFVSGYRVDIDAIGTYLSDQNILFCIDGIQTLGVLDTPVANADFLAADAHKWLLGPCGAGILYVKKRAQEKLRPTLLGWNNIFQKDFVTPAVLEFPQHAGRYEAGTSNLLGLVGLKASLDMLLSYGIESIEKTVIRHTEFLRTNLLERNFILAQEDNHRISAITSFRSSQYDMNRIFENLAEHSIVTTPRVTRDGHTWIRLSPHFYNTHEELKQFFHILDQCI
ncbi:aminotransferase class V-fold PLP-dependent enzyme [PVC group bacterium]|nr:aminotransferase class V-fold PLP-dependent enzyme [PVC group bacterium]